MLVKLETRSNRVKGLAFHPKRPWVLCSLHNGYIQLWDYARGVLIERYHDHDGPVRGVDFHSTQPLFVSGGDDYKIKVFNYKQHRCIFTLLGHLDYIRTVQFHPENPWIVSASDDQTVRIWNWQSRQSAAVLTGHNHYVMCAAFHPTEDLVVSASLDQTVRVWDISGLRQRTLAPTSMGGRPMGGGGGGGGGGGDLFGSGDCVVKFVLEGHERGVNWVSFHPTLPLIASGADDRTVKLWRYNEVRAWELDTLRGHVNNVSCCMFIPKMDLVISNSEDKSIRLWDVTSRSAVTTFRRESDRFWVLAVHPEKCLVACGHDNGMIVFKFDRERPAHAVFKDTLYYVYDQKLRAYFYQSGDDTIVTELSALHAASSSRLQKIPRQMVVNSTGDHLLIIRDKDAREVVLFSVKPRGLGSLSAQRVVSLYSACGAAFVSFDRFVTVDRSDNVLVHDLEGKTRKRISLSGAKPEMILPGSRGTFLLKADAKVILFDLQSGESSRHLYANNVKGAVWNKEGTHVAIMCRNVVHIATSDLKTLCVLRESGRVKSGAWNEESKLPVFVYGTRSHIKYALMTGDRGIICSMDAPVYITRVVESTMHFVDRSGKNGRMELDMSECQLKLALLEQRFDEVLRIVQTGHMSGEAIIAYLQKRGYPEVALHFVKDARTRFDLALECGNVDVALSCAHDLSDAECWHRLGAVALGQGIFDVVEMAYQRTRDFERLSFLYLVTGNVEKLRKMLAIAQARKDVQARFHNALLLGDVEERVRVLAEAGQIRLAYACAVAHGLEVSDQLAAAIAADEEARVEREGGEPLPLPTVSENAALLFPPTPLSRNESSWPRLTVAQSYFDTVASAARTGPAGGAAAEAAAAGALGEGVDFGDAWGADDLDIDGDDSAAKAQGAAVEAVSSAPAQGGAPDASGDGGAGGWDADLELEGDELDAAVAETGVASGAAESYYVPPPRGQGVAEGWRGSVVAADLAAAGDFASMARALHEQIGAVNIGTVADVALRVYESTATVLPTMPSTPAVVMAVKGDVRQNAVQPRAIATLPVLMTDLKRALQLVTEGKFAPSKDLLHSMLKRILFTVVDTKHEENELRELVGVVREYSLAMHMELQRREIAKSDPVRAVELACYFSHCQLQPVHLMLALRQAMTACFKVKNYVSASSFARRLIELNPKPEIAAQARKVMQVCDQMPTDAHPLRYDSRNPFDLCTKDLLPLYRGSAVSRCSYCAATFSPSYNGQLCVLCKIGEVGRAAPGLVCMRQRQRGGVGSVVAPPVAHSAGLSASAEVPSDSPTTGEDFSRRDGDEFGDFDF